MRFRATLFVVRTADGMQVRHYYDDFYATYSDMAAAGIGTLRYGAEATALIRLAYRWNLTLAASAGRYRYADNPVVTVYADANNEVLDRNAASYMGDCSVGNTPQLTGFAGLNYYGPKGWGAYRRRPHGPGIGSSNRRWYDARRASPGNWPNRRKPSNCLPARNGSGMRLR